MLELRIHAGQPAIPLNDLSAALGRTEAARTVGDQIEAMLALLDDLDGDPDFEENADLEPGADRELGYSEWHTRGRLKVTPAGFEMPRTDQATDDDEDDDPAEDDGEDRCGAGEDRIASDSDSAIWSGAQQHQAGSDDDAEDDDSDRCIAGDDMMRSGPTFHLIDWRRPTFQSSGYEMGCEDDAEPEDQGVRREQVRRIRNRACTATIHRSYGVDHTTYQLREFNTVAIGSASDLLTAP